MLQDKKLVERNLKEQARKCQWLVLWLDCDREGENIAFEVICMDGLCFQPLTAEKPEQFFDGQCWTQVIDVCIKANPRLLIKRAKFSALVRRELERSVQNLGLPDENLSKAVDARQEIDLRIGASFTRFQTLLLQVSILW